MEQIALIGGSGFYNFFQNQETSNVTVDTPFGSVLFTEGVVDQTKVLFLPRHGTGHSVPPHMINYRANIFALHKVDAKYVLATNAVGSMQEHIQPGSFVVFDQFIDLVSGPITFFEGDFEVVVDDKVKKGVVHTDVTYPYSQLLREHMVKTFEQHPSEVCHPKGCYVMNLGPRFETAAEIKLYRSMGGDVAGMTGSPEVILCKELGIEYSSVGVVTNMAAGLQHEVTHQEVVELFDEKIAFVQELMRQTISSLSKELTK